LGLLLLPLVYAVLERWTVPHVANPRSSSA